MPRFASLSLIAVLLAGCTSSGDIAAPESTDQAPSELAFSDSTGVEDGVLEIALIHPPSLLPIELSLADQNAVIAADLLYDGLVEANGTSLNPALATSWSSNDDFTVWTFVIDVDRVSIETVVDSLNVSLLGPLARPLPIGQVTGIEATPDGVQISLDSSNAGFAWLLSGLPHSIALPLQPLTGRYQISVDTDDSTLLVSLDPERPDVSITWVDNYQDTYESLADGSAEAAVVGAADLGQASAEVGRSIIARSISRFYVANMAAPAMQDADIRAAVMRAVDRESLVSFAPAGSFLADGLVPSTVAGFSTDSCRSSCDRDTTLASELVDSRPDLPTIRVGYVSVVQAAAAQSIVTDLHLVGLEAEAVAYDAPELADAVTAGDVELYSFGLVAGAGSTDSIIPMLHSESALNPTRLADPAIDEIIDTALRTADDVARWELFEQAHQLVLAYSMFAPVTMAQSELVWTAAAGDLFVRADGSIETQSRN